MQKRASGFMVEWPVMRIKQFLPSLMEHLDIIRMYVVTIMHMSMEKVDIPVAVMVVEITVINLC